MENENNMCKWIGVEIQDLFVRDEKKSLICHSCINFDRHL